MSEKRLDTPKLTDQDVLDTMAWLGSRMRLAIMEVRVNPELSALNNPAEIVDRLKVMFFDADPSEDVSTSSMFDPELAAIDQISTVEADDRLNELRTRDGLFTPTSVEERVSQAGERQAPIDRIADLLFTEVVELFLSDSVKFVAGEEKNREAWSAVRGLKAGQRFIIVDPVDGTICFDDIGCGFSINQLLYRAKGDGVHGKLIGGSTIADTGEQLNFSARTGRVAYVSAAGFSHLMQGLRPVPSLDERRGSIAIVATRGASRRDFAKLFDPDANFDLPPRQYGGKLVHNPAPSIYTLGGAPVMAKLLVTNLEYLIVPHNQTVYDAGTLVPIMMGGGEGCFYLEAATGKVTSLKQMMKWMSHISGPRTKDSRPFKAGLWVRAGAKESTTHAIFTIVQDALRAYEGTSSR